MNWFPTILKYYNLGLYNNIPGDDMYVGDFVPVGVITKEQFKEITGDSYPEVI